MQRLVYWGNKGFLLIFPYLKILNQILNKIFKYRNTKKPIPNNEMKNNEMKFFCFILIFTLIFTLIMKIMKLFAF